MSDTPPTVGATDVPSPATSTTPGSRAVGPLLLVGSLATVTAVAAILIRGPVVVAGSCALAALAVLCLRPGSSESGSGPLSGQVVPLAVATALLAVTDAGFGASWADGPDWRPILTLAAYPFLASAVLEVVARQRNLRKVDVVVEAVLVGVAAGIMVQVVVEWRGSEAVTGWAEAQSALPSILIGLDVALLVLAGHALGIDRARRGPLGLLTAAVACLLLTHMLEALPMSTGTGSTEAGALAGFAALTAIGATALHPRARSEPELLLEEPQLFSRLHAGVVVVALLAAPAVLVVQALRSMTASATMATGAVASGAILAAYLLVLLRGRATTEHRATHDGLTGLPNRVLFTDRLERAIAHARRNDLPVGVLFVDLDRFKEVNDTFGHAAGDQLLRAVAARLLACARDEDTVARLGGDEFALLLPHLASSSDALVVARRVLDALREPITIGGKRMLFAASVGMAVFPEDGASASELLASADAAMYRAKETKGSTLQVYNPALATQAHDHLRLEAALYEGLQRGELVLHYQPIVDLATGQTAGAEALVRWEHPERGLLMPGQFVPIAERSELVILLGEQVIEGACAELARWQRLGLTDRFISVNVASTHFGLDLVSAVTSALRTSAANPRNLMIELTESTAVDNLEAVVAALEELRSLGVRSAIDDFGTGYCGLRYLGTLPVDTLKIDQSFVQSMSTSDAAIVAATIAMGHSLGLTLTAEGVETPEQRRFLRAQGCDMIQGYLEARPMAADRLRARLQDELLSGSGAATAAAQRAALAGRAGLVAAADRGRPGGQVGLADPGGSSAAHPPERMLRSSAAHIA